MNWKETYTILGNFAVKGKCAPCREDSCHANPSQSDRIIYNGPNLPCTGIRNCDNLTCALEKIDEQICLLVDALYNLTTSTTTTNTSTSSTTSTSTTITTSTSSSTTTSTTTIIDCGLDGSIDCNA